MPKRVTGVSARLLECAKEEFLTKGFQNASIREIAQKANTSPRAVYTRFPDKEGLFSAIVDPVANKFLSFYIDYGNNYWYEQMQTTGTPIFNSDTTKIYFQMIDYAYDHLDEFKLIFMYSEGTRYANFIEQLTTVNCQHVEEYSRKINLSVDNFETLMKLLHMLTHSFYAGLFEPLIHDMSREEAYFYVRRLCDFFSYGIQNLLLSETK